MSTIVLSLWFVSLMPIVSAWVGGYYRFRQFGRIDNKHPRLEQSQLDGAGARAVASQANCWEALALWIVALFAAYVTGVPLDSLATVAWLFMGARLLHFVSYLANQDVIRSLAFMVAFGCCLYILVLAFKAASV